MLRIATAGLLIIVTTAILLAFYLGITAYTPRFVDARGHELPASIAVLEKVELGGLDQWILIRGVDRRNPVLLWLHGGPGGAQMPFAHYTDSELERHFVVVHWDQRGAGKSNHRGFDEATMSVEQYLDDAVELVGYLRERLGSDRVVLLGHSWGTRIGMHLVDRHPEYFQAYVGVSQVVDHARATVIAHDWLLEVIGPERAPEDLRALQAIEIPARRHIDFRVLNRLTDAYGGSLDLTLRDLARIAIQAPEYTVLDYPRLLEGMNRGGGPMHVGGIIADYNFVEQIPSVGVPVYFFMGARDYNTPLALVQEYYERLEAPHKEIVIFESPAHMPFLAEPAKFNDELIRIRRSLEPL